MAVQRLIGPRGRLALGALAALALLAACGPPPIDLEEIMPPAVGDFERTGGPALEADTGLTFATYEAPELGSVILRARQVGEEQVAPALEELPPQAEEVGQDEALGEREGVFFTYGGEFHAAWGNRDWVFVLSADSDPARRAFMAWYGF